MNWVCSFSSQSQGSCVGHSLGGVCADLIWDSSMGEYRLLSTLMPFSCAEIVLGEVVCSKMGQITPPGDVWSWKNDSGEWVRSPSFPILQSQAELGPCSL